MHNLSEVAKIKKREYYSSPLSLTSQFYFCPVPLRLDTYSGCEHNCIYCFANNSMQKFIGSSEFSQRQIYENVKPTKLAYVKKYFDMAFEGKPNTFSNQEAIAVECIKRKVPLHYGGMSDPCQPIEAEIGVTYEVLKLLKKYNYPVIFSTKGKLILSDKYFDLIKDYENFALQISIIDDRENVLKLLDPNAMTFAERIEALKKYKSVGKWTAVRIQPFIIGLTDSRIIPMLDKFQEVGVNHIMVEGLKFMSGNKEANERISKVFKEVTGESYNLEAFYRAYSAKCSGNDLELPSWRKYKYDKIFAEECKKRNMTFGCADNDLRFLGDSPCCCGIENLKGFENTLKHNTGHAIFRAMKQGLPNFDKSIIEQEWISDGKFRCPMSNENARARFEDGSANRPVQELFNNAWEKGGKNSPCDVCSVKHLGCGKYRFYTEEELKGILKDGGSQQRLI